MLTIHGWGDQSPPLEIEAIYRLCSVSTFIRSISAWISLFRAELHCWQFLLFW
jgi:hypothetical protein